MAQVRCPVLVGRAEQVAALDHALDQLTTGRGSFVSITGPAGIGKSRLVRELSDRAAARDVTVVTGRAVPPTIVSPYRPLTEALLQLLRDRTPPTAALDRWLPHLAPILPGVFPGGAPTPGLDQSSSVALRGESLLQLLRSLAPAGTGLVVALEDLHWADPETVALVEYLADNLADRGVLLVVTIRTEPSSPALDLDRRQRARPGVVHLGVERLGPSATDEMIAACGGIPAGRSAWIREVSEGLPLLIEDLLGSTGLPTSITDSVRERLATLPPDDRAVIESAAVLGRHFDWDLLPDVTGRSLDDVAAALERAVEHLLVEADGHEFRFRHAVTREAVLGSILPPRHRALAAAALRAIDAGPGAEGRRELVADLAVRAGEPRRAGSLLLESGLASLEIGALQTAIEALRRATELLSDPAPRAQAGLALVEALAIAGRVDEAADVGRRLVAHLDDTSQSGQLRTATHLRLAHAAVAATRWRMASEQLQAAEASCPDPSAAIAADLAVLWAEVALGEDDVDGARSRAEAALALDGAEPDVRCRAFEVIGRSDRLRDLAAAQAAFEESLAIAERCQLPMSRLRALHELGTIDMFDHVGMERLSDARRRAEEMGALSTVATLDLQLSACATSRWDLDRCDHHARSAQAIAEQLALDQVRAKALAMLTGSASMRADAEATRRLASETMAAAPGDQMLQGFTLASLGLCQVLAGDVEGALDVYGRGMAVLGELPHAEPAANRALWPLVLASAGDRRAPAAIAEARRLGVEAFAMNRGLLLYAEAVVAGRAGDGRRADQLASSGATGFVNSDAWGALARLLASEAARVDGWGAPRRWLAEGADVFRRLRLEALADRAARLLRATDPNPWAHAGVTDREADVLRLLRDGLANKAIAERLSISPRTVEKHVESLLRKTGSSSRAQLAVHAATTT